MLICQTIILLCVLGLVECEKEQPTVSIIIPSYNVAQYIMDCIQSIMKQTYRDFEAIFVEDCSTDNTGEILEEYSQKSPKIKVIHQETNTGTLEARNTGIRQAQGKYCCFLDPDDYFTSDVSLQILVEAAEKTNVDILHFDYAVTNAVNRKHKQTVTNYLKPYYGCLYGRNSIISCCFEKDLYHHNLCTKIFKTTLVKEGILHMKRMHLVWGEDMYAYFIIAFYARSYCGVHTGPLMTYRASSGITTKTSNTNAINRFLSGGAVVLSSIKAFMEREGVFEQFDTVYSKIYTEYLETQTYRLTVIPTADYAESFDRLTMVFKPHDLIEMIWRNSATDKQLLAERLHQSRLLAVNKGISLKTFFLPHSTIGLYIPANMNDHYSKVYQKFLFFILTTNASIVVYIENTSQIISSLANHPQISWVILPSHASKDRAISIAQSLSANKINVFLYNPINQESDLLDVLVIKSTHVPIVLLSLDLINETKKDLTITISGISHLLPFCDIQIFLSSGYQAYLDRVTKLLTFRSDRNNGTIQYYHSNRPLALWMNAHSYSILEMLLFCRKIYSIKQDKSLNKTHVFLIGLTTMSLKSYLIQSYLHSHSLNGTIVRVTNSDDVLESVTERFIHIVAFEAFEEISGATVSVKVSKTLWRSIPIILSMIYCSSKRRHLHKSKRSHKDG